MRCRTTMWIFLGILAFTSPSKGQQEICTNTALSACAGDNLASDRCLQLYYACGRYQEIIRHYSSEAWINDLNRDYYLGVSYYGLALRNRSKAAKCEYYRASRDALAAFIHRAQQNNGLNDQSLFEKTYHAVSLTKKLNELNDCPEAGFSEREIERRLTAYGTKVLESLFLGTVPDGALGEAVSNKRTSIRNSIKGFVSKAAFVETQLGLRESALSGNVFNSKSICQTLESEFQALVQYSPPDHEVEIPSLSMPSSAIFQAYYQQFLDPLTTPFPTLQNSGWLAYVFDFQTKIEEALGGCSISDYEVARDKVVALSKNLLQTTASLPEASNQLLDDGQIDRVSSAVSQLNAMQGIGSMLGQLQQDWLEYGQDYSYCEPDGSGQAWYCNISAEPQGE